LEIALLGVDKWGMHEGVPGSILAEANRGWSRASI
jgi:hypothetical protein